MSISRRRGSATYWAELLTMPRNAALAELDAWDREQRDLVGVAEIAERASVKPDTVQAWRSRHHGFPAPITRLASGPVWLWCDVATWLAVPRKAGRPRI